MSNTISRARFNDHHGPSVAEVIDRAGDDMRAHSAGCALIDGLMADGWDGWDPWGSTIEAAFALEYACQWHGLPNDPEFSSPYTTGDPDEGLLYVELRDAIEQDRITGPDIEFARDVFGRMLHAFKLAGLDY